MSTLLESNETRAIGLVPKLLVPSARSCLLSYGSRQPGARSLSYGTVRAVDYSFVFVTVATVATRRRLTRRRLTRRLHTVLVQVVNKQGHEKRRFG